MRTKVVSEEILYPDERIVIVAGDDVDTLKQAAGRTVRERARLCTHQDAADLLHEMLIVHTRDTYIRPHRQPAGRSESLHMIEGELDVVLFNDDGTVMTVMVMGEFRSGKPFYYRVAESLYHTLFIRSAAAVFHEITNGPFRPGNTEFASWAPAETDADAVRAFQADLERRVARHGAGATRAT